MGFCGAVITIKQELEAVNVFLGKNSLFMGKMTFEGMLVLMDMERGYWLYFDYGTKEKFQGVAEENRKFEKVLKEESYQIPVPAV